MDYIKTIIVLSAIFCFSLNSEANDGNDYWVTLKGIQLWSNTYDNPRIRVQTNDGIYNPHECSDSDSYFLNSKLPEEVRKRIYSTLLSAIVTGKNVRAYLSKECQEKRPVILSIIIQ